MDVDFTTASKMERLTRTKRDSLAWMELTHEAPDGHVRSYPGRGRRFDLVVPVPERRARDRGAWQGKAESAPMTSDD